MQNNQNIISIIIPVYNVEKYIEKCLQSVLDQTYKNFEAIIVDDGSPDNSIFIAKKLVGNDERFIFVDKENGGLSSARNAGLDHASGDYIMFLDSDDYLSSLCFEKVISSFQNDKKLDVLIFGMNIVTEQGRIIRKSISNLQDYYRQNDILLTNETISFSACDKVFSKKLFVHHRFKDGIIYEDKELIPKILFSKKLSLIQDFLYFYVQRDGSIVHTYNFDKALESLLLIYESYENFLISHNIYHQYENYYLRSRIKFYFYRQIQVLLNQSVHYSKDSKYLLSRLDPNIISAKNIYKYYGVFSKIFITCCFFKVSPLFLKAIYMSQNFFKGFARKV